MRMTRFLFIAFLIFGPVQVVFAEPNILGLNPDTNYDIYVSGVNGGTTVIQDVDIVGFRDVKGIAFLVVHTDSFEGKRSEGLVRLDYVQAVIPTHKRANIQSGIYR
ncbi:MAG: hypothetical protein NUV91_00050 [Candidatus Omnitrophica bacterium]|nr:hypothetical protein [Candidatus Omnitrophota bacterium]